MVDMEGYPVAQVAVMLDCAEGTVKSRCARGRERLATLLRDRLATNEPPRDAAHPEPDAAATRPIPVPPNPTPTSSNAGEGGAP